MGYFNIAYNIYAWVYMLSTAGLPVAVSVMIAAADANNNGARCRKIFRCAIIVFTAVGTVASAMLIIFSNRLAQASSVRLSYLCIICIAPSLLFVCISSAVRGYYQGYGVMWVTGVSQVTEAAGKLILGLLFTLYSIKRGDPLYVSAAFAILGITAGSALSALFCVITKGINKVKSIENSNTPGKVLAEMFSVAIPITISASVMNLTSITDVFLAAGRLISIGYTQTQATEIFGNYTTLAVSMFNMPLVFIYPIAYSIVPAISASTALCDGEKLKTIVNSAYKVAAAIALPCSVGLAVLSKDILELIFTEASAKFAAPMLTVLSASVFLCAMVAISNSVLQASGHAKLPIISMICGFAVKLFSTYYLVSLPEIGRLGIPLGTCLCYLTIATVNVSMSLIKTKVKLNIISTFVKPLIASGICGVSAYYINSALNLKIGTGISVLISILLSMLIYLISFLVLHGLSKADIDILPKSDIIYSVMLKMRLIKKENRNDRFSA